MKFKFACTGGTFDRLHDGHSALLKKAFASADKVLIGLTSNAMVKRTKAFSEIAKPYSQRKKELLEFLKKNDFLKRAKLVQLNDVYGPSAVKTKMFDCIVTSRKTIEGVKEVNRKRRQNGLKPLHTVLVETVKSQDSKAISSTRVRRGQIDRKGIVFDKLFTKTLSLTEKVLIRAKKPFGKLVKTARAFAEAKRLKPFQVIVVGDATAMLFENAPPSLKPSVVIVDRRIRRKKTDYIPRNHFDKTYSVNNAHGTITRKAAKIVEKAVEAKNHGRILVRVHGEEDLLTLPAVLFAPLDSLVCYGQPGKGMVLVKVTEEKKKQALRIALRMTGTDNG